VAQLLVGLLHTFMANPKIELKMGEEQDVAYLYLSEHRRGAGSVATQVRLRDIFPDYSGADIYLDLNEKRQLVGIEVLL
jgi:hypothetical protein